MSPAFVATVLVVPALFWAGYHVYHDRHQSEPPTNLFICFAAGIAAGFIGQMLYRLIGVFNLRRDAYELALTDPLGLLIYSVLAIGLLEELAKLLPFLLIALRFEEFDEPIDGVIYASFIALGMASYENFFYLQYLSSGESLARGIASPMVHIMFASIWGYRIGLAHLQQTPLLAATLLGLAVAALVHGVYDFAVIGLPAWGRPVSALLILVIWLWRMNIIRQMHVAAGNGNTRLP